MLEMKEVIRQAVDAERTAEWGKEIIEKNNRIIALTAQNKELQDKVAELLDVADKLSAELGIPDDPHSIPPLKRSHARKK